MAKPSKPKSPTRKAVRKVDRHSVPQEQMPPTESNPIPQRKRMAGA